MKIFTFLKFFLVSLAILAFTPSTLTGQSKNDFEKVFQKETKGSESGVGYGKFKNIARLSFYPDTLPSWFFNPPRASADYVYAIGISDPDLMPDEAVAQATHRAKSLAVLFNRALIQYFRDVYTSETTTSKYKNYRQRFDTYFKLTGTAFADSTCFSVANYHMTRYNEAIILIRFTPQQGDKVSAITDLISSVGTALYIEAQVGESFEPQAEYEFVTKMQSPKLPTKTAHYTYREKGNRFLSISEFSGKEYEFPMYNYKYTSPNASSKSQPLISYYGLWSAFSRKFLRQLTLETEQAKVNIKTIGEQYSPDNRNLIREVAIKTAKLHINGIEFGTDSIGFNIQLQELK
jgi:hypothetical protein